jgi:diacylglycerol kinase (ATP)
VPTPVAVIINPISGAGGRVGIARARAEQAAALIAARGLDAQVFLTERVGHARELTQAALTRGVTSVFAWGGDGTVNEVASALAFREATLGIIPSGSGNGLARELRIPLDPARAFAVALGGRECRMDAGELDLRLFFNVAGIGLDARVAHCFAADGLARRGLLRYLEIATREFFTYKSTSYTVTTDGIAVRVDALLIAIANSRQYGNGALIAPGAALDDGRLDVVVVAGRSPLGIILQAPRLFTGQIERVPGVTTVKGIEIEVTSKHPVPYHVDGEPFLGASSIRARARPGALRVVVPSDAPADVLGSRVHG